MKNLYLIKTEEYTWDEYDAFVICAENETEAEDFMLECSSYSLGDFSKSKFIKIGIAEEDLEKGIVLSSFNAG